MVEFYENLIVLYKPYGDNKGPNQPAIFIDEAFRAQLVETNDVVS